jgi:predicted protein tyrosine phosphatase
MPFIENVAKADIQSGFHQYTGEDTVLISILDHASSPPTPAQDFVRVHTFEFLDLEAHNENAAELGIQEEQAKQIVTILKEALANDQNVIVHCTAGICRSGAVAEVGVAMGFEDMLRYRSPNLMVKHSLMKELGWTYDSNEKPYEKHTDPTLCAMFK